MKKNLTLLFNISLIVFIISFIGGCSNSKDQTTPNQKTKSDSLIQLKTAFHNDFLMGTAISPRSHENKQERKVILRHFNSVTPENTMKMGPIHPEKDVYQWQYADQLVQFAQENDIKLRGHVLVWHKQTPDWLFVDENGQQVSKEELLKRMKNHIYTLVKRYKGKIYAWDVVNEAVSDNISNVYRETPWYNICDTEFLVKAFEYAHQADPEAKLYYNDYDAVRPDKRKRIVKLLKTLIDAGAPIDGVGIQAHWSVEWPGEEQLRKAIEAYASLGLDIHITELDISAYPLEHHAREMKASDTLSYTTEVERKLCAQYKMAFDVFEDYKEHISNVTLWGVSDKHTWRNSFPVNGRNDYPLLFDKNYQPKKALYEITKN